MATIEELVELPPMERRQLDCVEIYPPKNLRYLSEVYSFLRDSVRERRGGVGLEGFSIYEVDGVFRGANNQVWDERTLVIRILLIRPADLPVLSLRWKISDLGTEICRIAAAEEEIWICDYSQGVSIFRPHSQV
jgi:hypothetical protein